MKRCMYQKEKEKLLMDCFSKIQYELEHAIDKLRINLIVSNIEIFLNYCIRFYERQFITRIIQIKEFWKDLKSY